MSIAAKPLVAQSRSALGIAIEHRLATAAHLRVGDSVGVSPASGPTVSAIVSAIYEPAPDPSTIMRQELHLRMHLADLATLLGQPDRVDRMGVVVKPGTNLDSAADRLNRIAFGYYVIGSKELASKSSATFLVVKRFHNAIGFISILASAIFLLCLMLLKIEERRRDVAMLRFVGVSRRTVFISLAIEAAAIALVGSVVGAAVAAVGSAIINMHYRHEFATALVFSEYRLRTVGLAMALSLLLGIGAGALAAWRLVSTPPLMLWNRAT